MGTNLNATIGPALTDGTAVVVVAPSADNSDNFFGLTQKSVRTEAPYCSYL
jgi:hypothetical protein